MPRKTETSEDQTSETVEPVAPVESVEPIVTLTLKQRAYWRGELCEAGATFAYPKTQADEILATTELFMTA